MVEAGIAGRDEYLKRVIPKRAAGDKPVDAVDSL
jgi:hypothetical protein